MITFEDYLDLLEERRKIIDFFNDEAKSIAENAKYLRKKKVVKLQQKDNEKARKIGLSIYYTIYNKKLKEKGIKVSAVKTEATQQKGFKGFIQRLFKKKAAEIPGEIEELPENATTPYVPEEQPDIISTGEEIEDLDEELDEDLGGPEYTEEELDELYPNDKIPGQMDIEELNNGDVYES